MSPAEEHPDSPADEYDLHLAEQRAEAVEHVAQLARRSLWLHAAIVFVCTSCCGPGYAVVNLAGRHGSRADGAWIGIVAAGFALLASLILWGVSFLYAGAAAWATATRWPLLPPVQRAFSLLPWAIILTEFTAAIACWAFA